MIGEGARFPLVVSGCGTINALGQDVGSFWAQLLQGSCGIRALEGCFRAGAGVLAAAVPDPLPPVVIEGPVSRTDRLALVAAEEAVRQASLTERHNGSRVGIVLGTTTGGIREVEDSVVERGSGKASRLARLLVFEMANTSDVLAERFGFSGPRYTLHTACASGASAILLGAELILGGMADAVLAGGSDALTRLTLSGFRSLRALDRAPCRPFDRTRRGLSVGEGAGFVVLERAGPARSHGAPILAELLAAEQTTDAHHLTAPREDGSGAAAAMRAAMARARLSPGAVDHVNAHGTGTLPNDTAEAFAIRTALGDRAPGCPVTSIKGAIGHTLGASGAIEAIAAILTLRTGLIPPTVGLNDPDPTLGLDLVRDQARIGDWRVVLSNSLGFGGANVALCLQRWES